jgi:dolichol-phosphate mannosyltransferase
MIIMTQPSNIDIVVPVYNEERNIPVLIESICAALSEQFLKINIIIVDDGSNDGTADCIREIRINYHRVNIKYIRLSKNHGKDLAIKCGIDQSQSAICAIMDGDLQHPPKKIIDAYEKIRQGFKIVHIVKKQYHSKSLYRRIGSFLFKKLLVILTGAEIPLTDFKLLDSKVVEVLQNMNESNYFNRGIINTIGFKSTNIFYSPQKRYIGESKYSLKSLVSLALDSSISTSTRPLRLSIYIGIIFSSLSFFNGLWIFFEYFIKDIPTPGFATLGTALFFLGGIQLCFLGVIGEYVGKIFLQAKQRPQYFIEFIEQ